MNNPFKGPSMSAGSFSFGNLARNLSNWQKVAIFVVLQLFVIIIIASVIGNTIVKPRERVSVVDHDDVLKDVPSEAIDLYKQELWNIIEKTVKNADKSVINDAKIRADSYKEEDNSDDELVNTSSHQVSFIIDIDSIKQSYKIILSWDKNGVSTPIIDCLPVAQAKYPESVCYGTYRDTYDISLYLPYFVYPAGYDNPDASPMSPDIYIDQSEDGDSIIVTVSICDAESNKQKAIDYLKSTPIDLSQYTIIYSENTNNVLCTGEDE